MIFFMLRIKSDMAPSVPMVDFLKYFLNNTYHTGISQAFLMPKVNAWIIFTTHCQAPWINKFIPTGHFCFQLRFFSDYLLYSILLYRTCLSCYISWIES
jgi:hypothetical protein